MIQSRYATLSKSLEAARERFAAYRSECVLFAATLSRGLMEYAGWPRELVLYEPVAREGASVPTHRYIISLFGFEDFEVAAPTPGAL
ncbi:MAG TPA: hypothetical protein VF841_01875 [Anaeromyxobacter sp.]